MKAKIGYSKGMRTQFFQEFTSEGKLVGNYPVIQFIAQDEYKTKGLYKIALSLSEKDSKVKFYRGDFVGECFDTTKCQSVPEVNNKVVLTLKKTGKTTQDKVGIIAVISTHTVINILFIRR